MKRKQCQATAQSGRRRAPLGDWDREHPRVEGIDTKEVAGLEVYAFNQKLQGRFLRTGAEEQQKWVQPEPHLSWQVTCDKTAAFECPPSKRNQLRVGMRQTGRENQEKGGFGLPLH